jgi:hypothetical protein
MAFNWRGVDVDFQQYGHEGNGAQQVIDAFFDVVGRAPTKIEIAQYLPVVMAGDPNIGNVAGLRSEVAKLAAQQPKPVSADSQEAGTINQLFQERLGRAATKDEVDHFGSMLKGNQLDAYSLGTFLDQLPDVVRKKDAAFREGLSSELQSQDSRYFQEQVLPGVQSQFAKAGRSFDSSGFSQALAQQATAQNRDRESFLSNLSASQYGGSQAGAREDYLSRISRGYQQQDYTTGRLDQYTDYNMQKQAYDDYLRRYGKRSQGQSIGALAGGVLGAGAGFAMGGPAGGMAGYSVGSGLGGYAGSYF